MSTWTKLETHSDQAGQRKLVPLLAMGEDPSKRIDEIRAWEQRRAETARIITQILGEPTHLKAEPVKVDVIGEETLDDHIRRHIRIRSEAEDWIPAYLLVPKDLPSSPVPAMICLHQTVAQGKEEPCGIKGSKDLAFALQLVRRGFVCIAPDAIGFGERIPAGKQPYHDTIAFYHRHPGWSFMGKMIWDVSRVIDYLETLPYVDPLEIGCIGHSHGAYGSLFAGAFEPRVSLVIASCGFNTFRDDPQPSRWSHLTPLIPQLGTYLPDVASIPFDWHQVCSLIAPRPMFIWYATQDTIFPNTGGLDALFKDVRTVYGLYGAADDLAWHAFDGPHSFPDDARALAYRWLDERFFAAGDIHKVPASREAWERQRETIRRVIRRTIGTPATRPPPLDVKVLGTESLPESPSQNPESRPAGSPPSARSAFGETRRGELDAASRSPTDFWMGFKYERRLIEYSVDEGDRVKAYLCVPMEPRGRRPGVLVLHQTERVGKRESVGLAGKASLAFGRDLAERGYITLSPDSITAGDRIDAFGAFDTRGHYLRHPDLSAMGKMLYDATRAIDLLTQTDGVDANRIGAIGHSLGAEESLMLAAFDERVRATVSSCGYATFATDKNRLCWARDHWFSYMPKLRPIFLRDRLPHWDWGDVLRLVAPRALYQHTTREDNIFPASPSAYEAGEAARAVWQLDGQPGHLANVLKPGQHGIADPTRAEIYDWLDQQLAQK